jgi:hypothetical protein
MSVAIGFQTVFTPHSCGHGVCSKSLGLVFISQNPTKVRDCSLFRVIRMKEKEEKEHWKENSKLERIKMEKDRNKRQTRTNATTKKSMHIWQESSDDYCIIWLNEFWQLPFYINT